MLRWTVARGPTRTHRDANEAQRRDNDGRVRSNETPHGIDGGGVPLTSEGVIAAANRRRAAPATIRVLFRLP